MIHVFVVTPSVFLDGVFFNPVIRLHGARGLPLDFSPAYTGQLYALVVMSVVSALVVGWMKHRTVGLPGTILFTVGLFALGTYPEAMQRADSVHLTFAALLAVPLLVLTGSFLTRNRLMPLLVMATVIMTIPQMMQFISIVHKKQFGTTWITNDGRTIGGSPYTQRMIDYLQAHSKPSDSLFVGIKDMRFTPGNDVALYHLFPDLRPATYHVEFNPLSANSADSGLAGDIAKSDWVILNKSWNDFREPNASSIAGSNAPNEVIDKKFKLVLAADRYELYKRIAD
jgi:hypothetical protein